MNRYDPNCLFCVEGLHPPARLSSVEVAMERIAVLEDELAEAKAELTEWSDAHEDAVADRRWDGR